MKSISQVYQNSKYIYILSQTNLAGEASTQISIVLLFILFIVATLVFANSKAWSPIQ